MLTELTKQYKSKLEKYKLLNYSLTYLKKSKSVFFRKILTLSESTLRKKQYRNNLIVFKGKKILFKTIIFFVGALHYKNYQKTEILMLNLIRLMKSIIVKHI